MADAEERAAKCKSYKSRIISLKPKNCDDPINIHEDTLREHSSFFRAALDRKWKEGGSGEIELPEDTEEVVTVYVDYLYTGDVENCSLKTGAKDTGNHKTLARLYVFGEKVQDDGFCNKVMSMVLSRVDHRTSEKKKGQYPGKTAITTLYEGTPEGSPAQRALVAIYSESGRSRWFENAEDYPAEFLFDLTKELLDGKEKAPRQPWYERRKTWFKGV